MNEVIYFPADVWCLSRILFQDINVNVSFLFDQQEPLNVVSGVKSFNSGKPVKNNSFLYTFDELGNFTVASQGAPGYACTVNVISTGKEPSIYMKST